VEVVVVEEPFQEQGELVEMEVVVKVVIMPQIILWLARQIQEVAVVVLEIHLQPLLLMVATEDLVL
jgi:hypothetical protein